MKTRKEFIAESAARVVASLTPKYLVQDLRANDRLVDDITRAAVNVASALAFHLERFWNDECGCHGDFFDGVEKPDHTEPDYTVTCYGLGGYGQDITGKNNNY